MQEIYDKIQLRGASSLTDAEVLALLLDEGGSGATLLATQMMASFQGSLAELGGAELARLRMVAGLGLKRAVRLTAAVELGQRILAANAASEAFYINASDDVVKLFRPQIESLPHEECWVLYLTSSNRILERSRISQGGVQATVVDHRLIIKRALELLATQLIMVHNHPSGLAEPSEQDKLLTKKIADAARLFDIRLLDHLIIARSGEYSFLKNNLL
ncbi:MAG: DNA repair protein RadC [Alistipes sp.]